MTDLTAPVLDAAGLARTISEMDFRDCVATVVGYGLMGKEYVKALRALGVRQIRVCGRRPERLADLQGEAGVEVVSGGFEKLTLKPQPGELGIIAVPIAELIPAAEHLANLGFRRLMIEKPVSLWSEQIDSLADRLVGQGVEAVCAYNRVAYPAFYEVAARAAREDGITSCTYTFTEMIRPDWTERFSLEELARWGIANSMHVISMAHGLIGLPAEWWGHQARESHIAWHAAGAVFVGSGTSEAGVPFAYHADWGSTGRWSVEVHTAVASYLLCPMETVQRRSKPLGAWEEVPLASFEPDVKPGILEQVAVFLGALETSFTSNLTTAARLTAYGEQVFGYASQREGDRSFPGGL